VRTQARGPERSVERFPVRTVGGRAGGGLRLASAIQADLLVKSIGRFSLRDTSPSAPIYHYGAGESLIAKSVPLPEKTAICGLRVALSVMAKVPVADPAGFGTNIAAMAQLAPSGSLCPQVRDGLIVLCPQGR